MKDYERMYRSLSTIFLSFFKKKTVYTYTLVTICSTGVMVAPQVSILMVGVRFPCAAPHYVYVTNC